MGKKKTKQQTRKDKRPPQAPQAQTEAPLQPPSEALPAKEEIAQTLETTTELPSVLDTENLQMPEPAAAKCDTCGREGNLRFCTSCGQSYCDKCRTPYTGYYSSCMNPECGVPL